MVKKNVKGLTRVDLISRTLEEKNGKEKLDFNER
jgi:hypothetical protein